MSIMLSVMVTDFKQSQSMVIISDESENKFFGEEDSCSVHSPTLSVMVSLLKDLLLKSNLGFLTGGGLSTKVLSACHNAAPKDCRFTLLNFFEGPASTVSSFHKRELSPTNLVTFGTFTYLCLLFVTRAFAFSSPVFKYSMPAA